MNADSVDLLDQCLWEEDEVWRETVGPFKSDLAVAPAKQACQAQDQDLFPL